MKKTLFTLAALSFSTYAFSFQAQSCKDASGSELAVIAYYAPKKELVMRVQVDLGLVLGFSAIEKTPSVYVGINGLYPNIKPILNLKDQTLTLKNKTTKVKCSAYNGGE